jgi:hypothetical protein
MASTRPSSGAIAFTGRMAPSARDIPKPLGQDSFAGVVARSVPVPTTKAIQSLPTPPNSISPSLPPHGLHARASGSKPIVGLEQVDSDLDLQDGSAGSPDSQHGFDTAGVITPALLAKHHLPDILLVNGPLAIRHIMGYLTTSVPGFSGIPPAKARRLVVGALEGRGSGDVKFEKVGWGRWDARLKGQPPKESRGAQSPPPSAPSSYSGGIPIASNNFKRERLNAPSSSWAGDSVIFSHDDDMDITIPETEADKMSLDGDVSCSSSEVPEDELMGDDPDDITDDEDWATVGAAALRQASYSASGMGRNLSSSHLYTGGSRGGGGPSLSTMAKSAPLHQQQRVQRNKLDYSAFGVASDSQEREAIEALLRLGSV